MTTEQKYELAQWGITQALKAGANQVAVIITNSTNNQVEVRHQKIDKLEQSVQCSLTLRLFVENRYSAHTTNRLKKSELTRFITQAIEGTRFLSPDTLRSLPERDAMPTGSAPELQVCDPAFDGISTSEKIALARAVEQEVLGKDARLISATATYYDGRYAKVMVTSNGFKGHAEHTYFGLSASVSVKGEGARPEAHWSDGAVYWSALKKNGIGTEALNRALRKTEQKKAQSRTMQMLVENRQVGKLFGPLLSALNGAAIQQKNSFLCDKLQQQVASSTLTVTDNPWLPAGRASRYFDGEGLACKPREIVTEGVLQNYYLDTYYAKKLGMLPTSGAATNLEFTQGDKSPQQLMGEITEGIWVTGFNGGNCNGSTGDFSYGIEGLLIMNGKIVQAVTEMNITGNMLKLWSSIAALGNDPHTNSSLRAPSILFNRVDFSGK